MVDIFNYADYRLFIKEFLEDQKKRGLKITQRSILKEMGISSSGFLANVLSGKQNFTIQQVKDLSEILKLNSSQAEYLKYMVYFARAKDIDEKNDFYETLNQLRRKKLKKLSNKQLSLFSKWYYVVIRELLHIIDIGEDYKTLGECLLPSIKAKEAKAAIEELISIGVIKKNKDGFFKPVSNVISTGDEVQSFLVSQFQMSMMNLGNEAFKTIPAKERDMSGITLTLSKKSFTEVKQKIQDFRKQLLLIAEEDLSPERVYRCDFRIFPVSKGEKE